MANIKITDLTAYTDAASTDVLPIVDVGADVTKKITIGNVVKAVPLGTAALPGLAFDGDPNTGIYSPGADQVAISTNGTQRLSIGSTGLHTITGPNNATAVQIRDASNYAGELVTATDGTFHINARTTTVFSRTGSKTESLRITSTGALNFVGAGTAGSTQAVSFNGSAPVNSLVIDSSGRVGLGTSAPNYQLHVTTDFAVGASGFNQQLTFSNDTIQSLLLGTGYTALKLNPLGGNVGIGTTSPSYKLDVTGGGIGVNTSGGTAASILFNQTGIGVAEVGMPASENALTFKTWTGAALDERARIDSSGTFRVKGAGTAGTTDAVQLNGSAPANSLLLDASGRVLVGTSTSISTAGHDSRMQLAGTSFSTSTFSIQSYTNDATGAFLHLGKSRGATVGTQTLVQAGDVLGSIRFLGSEGTSLLYRAAQIEAVVEGTPSSSPVSMPARLVFSTTADGASSPTERMRISSSGLITMGTSPYAAYISSGGAFENVTNNATCATFQRNGGIGTVLQFKIDSNLPGSISCDTTSTSYNTSSDYRLKENIAPLTDAIDRVNQLQVHRFNFIAYPEKTVDGFIAHEAQAVVPECVTGAKDEVDDDGNPVYQGIDQSKLVPLLTAALQEALAEIESLKARLTAAGI